jgi:hypothetical protein
MSAFLERIDRTDWPGWKPFFLIAGLYDLLLGVVFFISGEGILDWIGMELPPHIAYIQLAAVFIAVQGLSYLLVWTSPPRYLGLVMIGVVYKLAYSGLALWYIIVGELPSAFFIPWAIIDVIFLVGFLLFLRAARPRPTA